jgi:hypothetical protein
MEPAIYAIYKFKNYRYISLRKIYNVLKHILKCFSFRFASLSIIHWDMAALRTPALQKAYEHNDRPAAQWNGSRDFSDDVDATISSVLRQLTERQSRYWVLWLNMTRGYAGDLSTCGHVQYHIVPRPTSFRRCHRAWQGLSHFDSFLIKCMLKLR